MLQNSKIYIRDSSFNFKLDDTKKKEVVDLIKYILSKFNDKEKKEILNQVLVQQTITLPISIFKANISSLEIIVKFLKEEQKKSIKDISKILKRKTSTIYNTYNNSKLKFGSSLDISDYTIVVPVEIFSDRKYSVLESLVAYLKENCNLQFKEISSLLNKSYSTIATVYGRYLSKKNENQLTK